jgi:hypothetical protein
MPTERFLIPELFPFDNKMNSEPKTQSKSLAEHKS